MLSQHEKIYLGHGMEEFQIIKLILEKIESQSSWGKNKLKEEILTIIVEYQSRSTPNDF